MRLWLSIVIATLIATFPLVALADGDSPGDDEIRLKGGGMLRGTIVSVEPGNEATIIVKGKEKTIPWSKIEKVEQGKYKVDDEEEEAPPKKVKKSKKDRDDEELDEPVKGAPFINIQSTYPDVQLTKILSSIVVVGSGGSATGMVSRGVCTAPCDEIVDGRDGAQFFFAAPGMVPSSPFSLKSYDGEVEARVRGGSVAKRFGGIMLAGLGGAGVLTGPLLIGLESSTSGILGDKPNYVPGIVILAAGVGALAGGIYMIVTSKTTFEIRPRDSESAGIRIENGVLRF